MSDAERRDRELDDFNKRFNAKLDKEIAGHENEWRQKTLAKYEYELREAKSCEDREDYFVAMEHYPKCRNDKLFLEKIKQLT